MMTRRHALKNTALACAAVSVLPRALAQTTSAPVASAQPGVYTLPPLPYAYDALEPHIDAQTMQIHHDKHHAAYVANLNKAVYELRSTRDLTIENVLRNLSSFPEAVRTTIRNNGGGHYNHSLFWQMMKKGGGGEPKAELAKAIDKQFGSFVAFKDQFTKAALGVFGSGWAWLVHEDGALKIETSANQDNPISRCTSTKQCPVPLLGVDVWEHAYYLKYQNKRADYISAWFNVVDWDHISSQFVGDSVKGI